MDDDLFVALACRLNRVGHNLLGVGAEHGRAGVLPRAEVLRHGGVDVRCKEGLFVVAQQAQHALDALLLHEGAPLGDRRCVHRLRREARPRGPEGQLVARGDAAEVVRGTLGGRHCARGRVAAAEEAGRCRRGSCYDRGTTERQ
ncbi:unnamed protein product [Chondrus crispus]|uniref:Uncharacterized protein n=1 Tax=Chondrus crispus TaxID=2769 RepID=R7QCY6_CHOCR|nr:unnamed protein product [Chondrus crispus]CDF35296.1 unnamed protein product [Chondrus crispus]|eukprot:XP_005715115.1 unnamed protein product [Chondrus crispus]